MLHHQSTESSWEWWRVVDKLTYKYEGNEIHLAIPFRSIGVNLDLSKFIDFKWIDSIPNPADILSLYVEGDSAPSGRFCYRYPFK
jgi:hypothetical protein